MKKIVITYGLIAGVIVSIWMFSAIAVGIDHMDTTWGMILGFTAMLVAFSFIVVAVKNYRDHHNGGAITFGKAFQIGLYISLIASTIYVITWMIDYHFFVPDFMDQYAAHTLEKMKESGAAASEIQKTSEEMAQFREMYKNPFFVALITYSEILPLGLAVSLIIAAVMKRKPNPAL